ncbi:MAG: hypothetical protein J6A94_05150 [Lachnospiraceae bacterium]|nr:hypothetical protein [Lachnospiraceae bacterium]
MGKLSLNEDIYKIAIENLEIKNAFEDWEKYRDEITDFIISNSNPGKTAAIFGAGKCNDLDLCKLSGHFEKIFLIDIDEKSMKDALKNTI